MKIITAEDIRRNIRMSDMIPEMKRAYLLLREGRSITPLRTVTDPEGDRPQILYKPSYDCTNGQIAVKLLSQLKRSKGSGIPTIQGLVVLFDGEQNSILSVMDGRLLTAMRTGAASGLATEILSRKDSRVLAVFGAGAQAYTQIQAIMEVRPIERVVVFDLFPEAVDRLVEYFTPVYSGTVFAKGNLETDLGEADIICTVTNSKTPLFATESLKQGVHINAIGSFCKDMVELPEDVYTGALLYVDQESSCFVESGDLIGPSAKGIINETNYRGEIVGLITGAVQGRDSADRRTIFKSVGVATQDLVTAQLIYNKALKHGFGIDVDL